MNVAQIFNGRDADATTKLYATLQAIGPSGVVATNLLRASKNSGRAPDYRRGKSVRAAYDTKQWALGQLCEALEKDAAALGIVWGWKRDRSTPGFSWVLYVELPRSDGVMRQASYHSSNRLTGPDFSGEWDGKRGESHKRVIAWSQMILDANPNVQAPVIAGRDEPMTDDTPMPVGKKHKGVPMREIPDDYLAWLVDQDFMRLWPKLRSYIERRLRGDKPVESVFQGGWIGAYVTTPAGMEMVPPWE